MYLYVHSSFVSKRAVNIRPAEMPGPHVILLIPLMVIFARQKAVQSENILALINLASPSHYLFNRALTRSLAARGHQVCLLFSSLTLAILQISYLKTTLTFWQFSGNGARS